MIQPQLVQGSYPRPVRLADDEASRMAERLLNALVEIGDLKTA